MLEILEQKLKDICQKIEQSAANHNALIGAKTILDELHQVALKASQSTEIVEDIVSSV